MSSPKTTNLDESEEKNESEGKAMPSTGHERRGTLAHARLKAKKTTGFLLVLNGYHAFRSI
jgi:hypothetical protein